MKPFFQVNICYSNHQLKSSLSTVLALNVRRDDCCIRLTLKKMWHYSSELNVVLEEIDRQKLFGEEYVRLRHPHTGQTYRMQLGLLQTVEGLKPLSTDEVMVRAIAARITESLKRDVMLSPLEANIISLPHQLYALNRALKGDYVRFLLADEVGLGKTIEAGLIMRELKLRGEVERVLVLAPKSLLVQWVQEMETRFGESFELVQPYPPPAPPPTPGPSQEGRRGVLANGDEVWKIHPQVVVSMDSVKPLERRQGWTAAQIDAYNRKRFGALIDAGWDLVIIDEAHKVAGASENVARHQLARGLADTVPHLLLLSATPHSGKTEAFHRLMSLLDVEAFPSVDSVSRERVQPYVIRTEKRHAVDTTGRPLFKNRHTRLIPVEWKADDINQRRLYESVTEYVIEGYNRAQQEKQTAIGFLMVLMQRLVTSSTRAIHTSLQRRLNILDDERWRLHKRASAISLSSEMNAVESAVLSTEKRRSLPRIEELLELDAQEQLDKFMRLRLKGLLEERSEVQFLLELAGRAEAEGTDAKAKALLDWMTTLRREEADPNLKFLIFTEFIPTQEMRCEFLQLHGYSTVTLNGSMSLQERREAQEAFSESAQVLVSTEAGGEGLNLQFCHVVINYDLPWNPMRLEQRIGRVDRIGQSHDVRALNFQLADSVEYRVQEVLEEKLQTILKEFGVDKTSDVLDSIQAEADFTRLHIRALLNPSQIEAEAEELVEKLRAGVSRESRNLITDEAERDASQALMLEGHPMPFWVEKLVIHAVRGEGGSAENTLTGWNLRWKDGTEMKDVSFHRDGIGTQRITLEHPRVRSLLTAPAIVAPGMPIPRFQASGLPTALKGIWSLWELQIVPALGANSPSSSLTDTMRRVFPVFLNEQGRPLWSSARTIWEWFLREDTMLHPDGLSDASPALRAPENRGLFEKVASAAESQAHPLFEEMKAEYQEKLESERKRVRFFFDAKRNLLSRIGLETVRRYRERELTSEYEQRMEQLEKREHIAPELTPILIVGITGVSN